MILYYNFDVFKINLTNIILYLFKTTKTIFLEFIFLINYYNLNMFLIPINMIIYTFSCCKNVH